MLCGGGWWVDQPITDPISGPSFDFTFTFGPELDNSELVSETGRITDRDRFAWVIYTKENGK